MTTPVEAYLTRIACSRDRESWAAAIAADPAAAADALGQSGHLLEQLENLPAAASVDRLRGLIVEIAVVAGRSGIANRLLAQRHQFKAIEAMIAADAVGANQHFLASAEAAERGDDVGESVKIMAASVMLLFSIGQGDVGLEVAERVLCLAESRASHGVQWMPTLVDLARTVLAPANARWARVLRRVSVLGRRGDDTVATPVIAARLAAMLVQCGATEAALDILADALPGLQRLGYKDEAGVTQPIPDLAQALLVRARAYDLSGHEAQAEAAYRGHPWFLMAESTGCAEVKGWLAEFLIENNRPQEALQLLATSGPADDQYRALFHALSAVAYAELNRFEASESSASAADELLRQASAAVRAPDLLPPAVQALADARRLNEPRELHLRARLLLARAALLRGGVTSELEPVPSTLDWARRHGHRAIEALCLQLQADGKLAQGEAHAASLLFEQALECVMVPSIGNVQLEEHMSGDLPLLDSARIGGLRRAREQAGVGMDTMLKLADAHAAAGEDPVPTLERVIAAARRRNRRLALFSAHVRRARWFARRSGSREARADFRAAADVLETLRADAQTIESQIGLLQDKETVYGELLSATVDSSDSEEAMRLMERAKSRALLEAMAASAGFKPLTHEEEAHARDIRKVLARSIGEVGHIGASRILEIEQLKDRFAALYQQGDRRAGISLPGGQIEEVIRVSARDVAVLHYFVGEQVAYAAIARAGKLLPPVRLAVGRAEIEQLLDTLGFELATRDRCYSLTALHQALLEPLEAALNGVSEILVIPHGVLHRLPVHALRSRNGRYVSQRWTIGYAPSVAVGLQASMRRREAQGNALLMAATTTPYAPLPGLDQAAAEVRAIAPLYPRARVVAGRNATRGQLLESRGALDVLHLACHGEFDKQDPLLSRLYFADGPLYGYEIERLSVRPRLVVLSACETAVQERAAGDEAFGLVRAFLGLGAEMVVASLWKVADPSTAKLMEMFHHKRKGSRGRVWAALRSAQTALIDSVEHSHPFHWAPYVAIGAACEG